MKSSIETEIQTAVSSFADQITSILQRAVVDSVASALNGSRGGSTGAKGKANAGGKRRPGRPARATSVSADQVLAEVKRNGGRRTEEIAKALNAPSKDVSQVMKKLLTAKKVKSTGQARGTKYRAA